MFNHAAKSLLLGLLCLPSYGISVHDLSFYLKEAQQGGSYIKANDNEVLMAKNLFERLLKNENSSDLTKAWQEIGFNLVKIKENGQDLTIIYEQPNQKRGRGFYAFKNLKEGNSLEAPHDGFDLFTGAIAKRLFIDYPLKAAAWNTVSRKQIDLAHSTGTFFQAFSEAVAVVLPQSYLIQLHGFARKKAKTSSGQEAQLILSNGTKNPSATVVAMAKCLKNNLTSKTYLYPITVKELGATTNLIAKNLRNLKFHGFIHVEMSHELRKILRDKQKLQKNFVSCLPAF